MEGVSLVYFISAVEVASMYACAITVRQESTVADLLISNTKSGFFIKLTQKRRGKLHINQYQIKGQGGQSSIEVGQYLDTCWSSMCGESQSL